MAKIEYLLKYHGLYYQRIERLKTRVRDLNERLGPEDFKRHEIVKLAARIRAAEKEIAENPNRPEYLLHGELRKFRRYKRGLGRYRIIFCFSNNPPIILFLYLNTEENLRKEGSRSDPYEEFKALLRSGRITHEPADPMTQKWIAGRTK